VLAKKMKFDDLPEQLFASAVGMDAILDGFSGVLVEIYCERDSSGGVRYVLLETASASGNRLLRFTSTDPSLVARVLAEEIGGLGGFEEASVRLLR
jgi:hypothetical protein